MEVFVTVAFFMMTIECAVISSKWFVEELKFKRLFYHFWGDCMLKEIIKLTNHLVNKNESDDFTEEN